MPQKVRRTRPEKPLPSWPRARPSFIANSICKLGEPPSPSLQGNQRHQLPWRQKAMDEADFSGAGFMVQPAMPTFQIGTGSSPTYSTSHSAPCCCTWKSNRGQPKPLGPCHSCGRPRCSSCLLASAQHCNHLGSESTADERSGSLSFFVSLCFR